jgi:carbonic anhydrase
MSDVPPAYRDTAIADLLGYHNLSVAARRYSQAELLIGMCIDNRKQLSIPENFAYVMRTAGANFRGLEFQASFAVAVGGVQAVALIGHDQCGMSGLNGRSDVFVSGLVARAGWERHIAEQHFEEFAQRFEVGDVIAFIRGQARHFRQQYPKLTVAPMFYQLDDGRLYVIDESDENDEKRS